MSRILSDGGVFERYNDPVDFTGCRAKLSTILVSRFGALPELALVFSSSELSPSSPSSRLSFSPGFARSKQVMHIRSQRRTRPYHCFAFSLLSRQPLAVELAVFPVLGRLLSLFGQARVSMLDRRSLKI